MTPGSGSSAATAARSQTPSFDALAANGLRYNNMHTTALCSPSRSCIVTGRNHHANAMAAITELASGYPGYNGVVPFENGFLSEMLVEHGYSTFMVGKCHLTPSNQETARGPVRPVAAGARLPALLRLPGRRHQPVVSGPGVRQPPGRAAADAGGGLPPQRGPGRQGDASSSPTSSRSTRTSRSTCTCASAPRTRRTTCRRNGRTGTRACSTTAGTPTGRRCSPGRRNSASSPPTPSCRGTIPTCPTGRRCRRRRAGCSAG